MGQLTPPDDQISREVAEILRDVNQRLQNADASPFSDHGFRALKVEIATYISDLVRASIGIARRRGSDTVSAAYVEEAAQTLITRRGHVFVRNLGAVGGVLLGAGGSTILTIVSSPTVAVQPLEIGIALTVTGSVLMVIQIVRDLS